MSLQFVVGVICLIKIVLRELNSETQPDGS